MFASINNQSFGSSSRVNMANGLTNKATLEPALPEVTTSAMDASLNELLDPQTRSDYAMLCRATNRNLDPANGATIPDGYRHIESIENDRSGFSANVFMNAQNNPVLVFKATDINDFWGDIYHNDYRGILLGDKIPPQVYDALDCYDSVRAQYGDNLEVTGQSLGGYLAENVAGLRDVNRVVTFNAPGARESVMQLREEGLGRGSAQSCVNIVVDQDAIGNLEGRDRDFDGNIDCPDTAGHIVGQRGGVFVVEGDSTAGVLANHVLWNRLAAGNVISIGNDPSRYTAAYETFIEAISNNNRLVAPGVIDINVNTPIESSVDIFNANEDGQIELPNNLEGLSESVK